MRDPFFAPPRFVVRATQPLANALVLKTLPLHMHEIIPSFAFYQFISSWAASRISRYLFPKIYPKLSERDRTSWDVHVVSMIQSCLISTAALWLIFADKERRAMNWQQRVWGYSGAIGMIQGFSTGYFLWDLLTCARDTTTYGWGALAHAASALAMSMIGYRPFVNYYGMSFIMYELSTPFLNIHWFLDKLRMTGSQVQWVNGIILLATFGCSRILWGTYSVVRMYQDVWRAIRTSGGLPIPLWLATVYLASNTVLSGLNFYWFGRMISTVRARFDQPKESGKKKDA